MDEWCDTEREKTFKNLLTMSREFAEISQPFDLREVNDCGTYIVASECCTYKGKMENGFGSNSFVRSQI